MPSKKITYMTPAGRNTVLVQGNGKIIELVRDGLSFPKSRSSEQRRWRTEAEWRATVPADAVFVDGDGADAATVAVSPAGPSCSPDDEYFLERAAANGAGRLALGLSPKDKAFYGIVQAAAEAERNRVAGTIEGKHTDAIRAAREAYDKASTEEEWEPAFPDQQITLWLSWGGELMPVFANPEARVLRFRRGDRLLTLEEIMAPRWATLWSLRSDGRIMRT
jgi:hypothetical protein